MLVPLALGTVLVGTPPPTRVPLDLPLFDTVDNLPDGSGWLPSWEQAEDVNLAERFLFHEEIHRGFARLTGGPLWLRRLGEMATAGALDGLTFSLPGGETWAHEEGHRSVLIHDGIASLNGDNDPPGTWPDGIQVYGVYDDALVALKAAHPIDLVRMEEAGFETRINTMAALEAGNFFYQQDPLDSIPLLWMALGSDLEYFQLCDQGQATLEPEIAREGTNQARRDVDGADCDAWVYDLFRPNEPYAARGPHPLGGIRRDRLPSDLTGEEHAYLHQQLLLQLLNALDPEYWWPWNGFAWGERRVDGRVLHQVTSYGDAFDLELLAQEGELRARARLRVGRNRSHLFPALGAEVVRLPVVVQGRPLALSLAADLWLQPSGQSFTTDGAQPGMAAAVTLHQGFAGPWETFLRLSGKTEGWQPLQASLGSEVSATVGLTWMR